MPTYGSRSLWTSAGAGLDSATTAWVAAVVANGGSVSAGRQTIVNDLIVGLKADSIWTTRLDRLWLHAGENQPYGLTDIVALDLAVNNGAAFGVDAGFTGDGVSAFIALGYKPSTDAVNYSLDSACLGVWIKTLGSGFVLSANDGSEFAAVLDTGGAITTWVNDFASGLSNSGGYGAGFWVGNRSGTSARQLYKNGVSNNTNTDSSTTLATGTAEALRRNDTGGSVATDEIAAVVWGGSLDATEQANLYSRLRTYMTAIGIP